MKLSIVIPVYNEVENIQPLCKELRTVLKQSKLDSYEVIFVDDGSTDGTLQTIQKLAGSDAKIKYLSFSRNFGQQAALRAGMAYSQGEAVITMDADLQHPPDLIPQLLEHWAGGKDIVITHRRDTRDTGVFKRLSSALFYRFSNFLMGMDLEYGTADFRLLDRRVISAINKIKERRLFMRAFVKWAGFQAASVEYVPPKRHAGRTKYTFAKMNQLALDGITQFSIRPLRLVTILGIITMVIAFAYGGYALWVHFIGRQTVAGWTSLAIVLTLFFGIQFLVLGIIGEYLGRTFLLSKDWPDYIIRESNIEVDDPTT